MRNKKVLFIVQAALIAAIYVALTYLSSIAGLASGTIQVRISEALCILPVFTTAAIPGLWLGCFLANMLTGGIPVDVVCGSIATLIGAFFTYQLRNKNRFLAPLPPIIANTVIVPFVLRYGVSMEYRDGTKAETDIEKWESMEKVLDTLIINLSLLKVFFLMKKLK